MGTVYKRGQIYWIKYYRNGKPYRESTRSKKEADAKRLLRKREGEISEGKLPGVYFDKVRFEELAHDFLTDYRINGKKSLDRVEGIVNMHLLPYFGEFRATDVTTPLVKEYVQHRQEQKAANATINRELAALKRMFNLGARSTPPRVARVPYIPMLAENNVRKGFLEHEEFLALREALPEYVRGLVTLGYKTGWRLGELRGLTWQQVDMAQGTIRIEAGETKNSEGRTVYMDEELREVLRAQFIKRRLGCAYVFHREGNQIKSFRKAWKAACKKAGLGERLFHDLRRTAVRNMVRAGVPERVAMTITGHKTRSVFDRYNIVSPDDLLRASSQVETYLQTQ